MPCTGFPHRTVSQLGCAGVDMEASAVATVCAYYAMECTVALLVSD